MPMQPIPIEGASIGPGAGSAPGFGPGSGLALGRSEAGSGFEVELEVFSGPLGLLLHLIESHQLDVLTVPLSDLADAYVAHLAANPVHPAQLAAPPRRRAPAAGGDPGARGRPAAGRGAARGDDRDADRGAS